MGETKIIVSLILFGLIFIVFIIGIIIFIRQYRIKRKIHIQQIKDIDIVHKQELLETQVEIQTQTMKYIGREIHDNIGQKLTLASLYIKQLSFENKTPKMTNNVNEISEIIDESLKELRQLSKSLTSDSIMSHSISELIEDECRRVRILKKCEVHFENHSNIDLESYQIKSILIRITQEFLQNSIKHANCKNIWASMCQTNEYFQLSLEDDGKGFDINSLESNGIGLKNMEKRTELIGGNFILESQNEQGTILTIQIPL